MSKMTPAFSQAYWPLRNKLMVYRTQKFTIDQHFVLIVTNKGYMVNMTDQ